MNKPKFRAWDKVDQKMRMVEELCFDSECVTLEDFLYGKKHHSIVRGFEEVILMQYTGLKDNSEEPIEIWQKSIVKIVNNDGDYFFGVVEYFGNHGYPAFDIDCKYHKDWHFDSNVLSEALGNDNLKIYVIGDEYSNPELLNEVGKQCQ
ncbi:hypothetical protein JZO86_06080 [Enterococcus ureasiticus]|uniref:YopX family protein n=1 Tax=Enterococcus ureasiticus TaxID=903984 RepID=UPI001A8C8174|nr:YopX family protein [Enterococcus ureasiticus]MBO0473268.1 hypothetical protein [Enterococcus ureasiticus]